MKDRKFIEQNQDNVKQKPNQIIILLKQKEEEREREREREREYVIILRCSMA